MKILRMKTTKSSFRRIICIGGEFSASSYTSEEKHLEKFLFEQTQKMEQGKLKTVKIADITTSRGDIIVSIWKVYMYRKGAYTYDILVFRTAAYPTTGARAITRLLEFQ